MYYFPLNLRLITSKLWQYVISYIANYLRWKVVELNCIARENIRSPMATWYSLTWPHQLFHFTGKLLRLLQKVKLIHLK